jgi:protein-L-isoaspartate(D-aspartate) O-methyltransferase
LHQRVLEIGTGCGYQAAILSLLCKEVYSLERIKELHLKAKRNLRPLRLPNLHLLLRDGAQGYETGSPFSGILSAAGAEHLPRIWIDQLDIGGRLVAPVQNQAGRQSLLVIDRTPSGIKEVIMEDVHFVPLKSGIE